MADAQSAIFAPFFAVMLLTLLVWVYLYLAASLALWFMLLRAALAHATR